MKKNKKLWEADKRKKEKAKLKLVGCVCVHVCACVCTNSYYGIGGRCEEAAGEFGKGQVYSDQRRLLFTKSQQG